jgi:hypothetical protein
MDIGIFSAGFCRRINVGRLAGRSVWATQTFLFGNLIFGFISFSFTLFRFLPL